MASFRDSRQLGYIAVQPSSTQGHLLQDSMHTDLRLIPALQELAGRASPKDFKSTSSLLDSGRVRSFHVRED